MGVPRLGASGALANDPDTAVIFSKDDQAIIVGDAFDFTGLEAYSLEAWAKPSLIDGTFRHVFIEDTEGGGPREEYGVYLRTDGTNDLGVGVLRDTAADLRPHRDLLTAEQRRRTRAAGEAVRRAFDYASRPR